MLITVISTMGTVEQALNTIFNVPQSRSYFRKFSDYLSVLFTVPFLIVAALGVTAVFSVRISEFPFSRICCRTCSSGPDSFSCSFFFPIPRSDMDRR